MNSCTQRYLLFATKRASAVSTMSQEPIPQDYQYAEVHQSSSLQTSISNTIPSVHQHNNNSHHPSMPMIQSPARNRAHRTSPLPVRLPPHGQPPTLRLRVHSHSPNPQKRTRQATQTHFHRSNRACHPQNPCQTQDPGRHPHSRLPQHPCHPLPE